MARHRAHRVRHRAATARAEGLRRVGLVASAAALAAGTALAASAALGVGPAPGPGARSGSAAQAAPGAATAGAGAVPPAAAVPLAARSTAVPAAAPATRAAVAAPTSVRVPSVGVSSPLVRLGVGPDGALQVPVDAATAGWFAGGPAPGAAGPAVLAGHLDSRTGPGAFAALPRVAVGAAVQVGRADGTRADFVVTAVRRVPKTAFPTDAVYGPVAGAELRLITCGGAFDRRTGHYVDDVVVFARLVSGA